MQNRQKLEIISLGKQKTFVTSFGRLNPPHMGHADLVNCVTILSKRHSAENCIFLSTAYGANDPLTFEEKIQFARQSFPNAKFLKALGDGNNPWHSLKKIYALGFKHLILVAGDDRVKFFENGLRRFNGTQFFNFNVISLAQVNRTRDSNGEFYFSGSKLRKLIQTDCLDEASRLLSPQLNETQKLALIEKIKIFSNNA